MVKIGQLVGSGDSVGTWFILTIKAKASHIISSLRSSSVYHGLLRITYIQGHFFKFHFWKAWDSRKSNLTFPWIKCKIHKYTNTKCLKDPTYAIFFKSMGFKHIKYDIAVYQGGRSWQPFVHLKKSTKSFHGRRIFKFSRLGQLYQHPDGAYCRPMDAIFHIVLCVNRSMEPRHGRIIYYSRSCHLLSLLWGFFWQRQWVACSPRWVKCLESESFTLFFYSTFLGFGSSALLVASFGSAQIAAIEAGFPESMEVQTQSDNDPVSQSDTYWHLVWSHKVQAVVSGLFTSSFALGNFCGPTVSGIMYDLITFKNNAIILQALVAIVFLMNVLCALLKSNPTSYNYISSSHSVPELPDRRDSGRF